MAQETQASPVQQRRTDTHLARVVDIGVGYLDRLGYPHAKAYLREQGVPPEVISRILSSGPGCRRADGHDGA